VVEGREKDHRDGPRSHRSLRQSDARVEPLRPDDERDFLSFAFPLGCRELAGGGSSASQATLAARSRELGGDAPVADLRSSGAHAPETQEKHLLITAVRRITVIVFAPASMSEVSGRSQSLPLLRDRPRRLRASIPSRDGVKGQDPWSRPIGEDDSHIAGGTSATASSEPVADARTSDRSG